MRKEEFGLREIVSEDDVNKFDEYIGKNAALPFQQYPALLDLCLENQALKCALYLVQGNLPYGPPSLHHQLVEDDDGHCVPCLFTALTCLPQPLLILLLLNHCGAHLHANQTILGFYPLHFALTPLQKHVGLFNWSPGAHSLVKLLLVLFLPQMRPTMECARLVAEYTNSVNEVALSFIRRGELIQLAGLLIVARKKAMHPLSTGHNIKQGFSMEDLVLQVMYGEGGDSETTLVAGLFDIFDKAGDKLAAYFESLTKNEPPADEVIVRVAEIMQSVGIQVLYTDVDFTDIKRSSINLADLSDICKRLGIEKHDTKEEEELEIGRKTMFRSWKAWMGPYTRSKQSWEVKSVSERLQTDVKYEASLSTYSTTSSYPIFGGNMNSLGTRTYSTSSSSSLGFGGNMNSLGTRRFSTSNLIVDKISNQLKGLSASSYSTSSSIRSRRHSWTCRPSLSSLALKLKKAVRLV